ncbi:hypothetical protein LSAT2_000559 [Lamellibrachia satsuma]|nr:hypothetical protein LSAT2_000559 [Lamellibrachia satsuma]
MMLACFRQRGTTLDATDELTSRVRKEGGIAKRTMFCCPRSCRSKVNAIEPIGSSKCTPTSGGVLFSEARTSSVEELDKNKSQGHPDAAECMSVDTEDAPLPSYTRVVGATNGPDEIVPAESVMTWHRSEAVKLRMQSTGHLSEKPISLPTLLLNASRKYADKTALAVKRNGDWVKWNYEDYYKEARTAAKAFIKLGLEPYSGVGVMGFNSPEWFFSSLGCIFAGGLSVGIYTTNTAEATKYVAEMARCNIIVVENDQLLEKVLQVWDRLPHLKAVVQYIGEPKEKIPNVYSWKEMAGLAKEVSENALNNRLRAQAVNKACMLIFTVSTIQLSLCRCITLRNIHIGCTTEVIVVYRPLASDFRSFLDDVGKVRLIAAAHIKEMVVCGDFNTGYGDSTCANAMNMADLLETSGFDKHAQGATREHGDTLDMIITSGTSHVIATSQRLFSLITV